MKASVINYVSLFAGATMAAPRLISRQDGEIIWENEDGGNVIVSVGNGRTDFGSVAPKSSLEAIRAGCTTIACKPNEGYTVETLHVGSPWAETKDLTLTVEGSFAEDGQKGDLNQLLQIIEKTLESLHAEGITTDEEKEYIVGTCPPNVPAGCPGQEKKSAVQWRTTDHIAAQVSNDDGGTVGFINFAWSMDGGNGDSGVCQGLFGMGTTLSGAIPTIGTAVGAGLTLASLLCDS